MRDELPTRADLDAAIAPLATSADPTVLHFPKREPVPVEPTWVAETFEPKAHGNRPVSEPPFTIVPLDLSEMLSKPEEPIRWIIDGYLAVGENAVLGGHAGAGKTIVATDWAIAASLGGQALQKFDVHGGPFVVAFLDEEMQVRLAAHRLRAQFAAHGVAAKDIGDVPFHYVNQHGFDLTQDAHVNELRRFVERKRVQLLFLDSMIRFAGRLNTRDESDVAYLFGRAVPLSRDHGCTVVWTTHRKKPGNEPANDADQQQSIRGSSDIPAAVSEVLVLDKLANGSRTLHHTKCRWQEEQVPLGIEIQSDENVLRPVAVGVAADADALIVNALVASGRDGSLRTALVAVLEDAGSRDAQRLATKTLGRLHARARVMRAGGGRGGTRYWLRDLAPAEVRNAEMTLREGNTE